MPSPYSTIKDDKKSLESLLNRLEPPTADTTSAGPAVINGIPQVQSPATASKKNIQVDPAQGLQPEPLFDYDPEKYRKRAYKRAYKKITELAKHSVRPEYLKEEYINEKILMDVDTLTQLYEQYDRNNIMQSCIVALTARGNLTARNIEVFGQLTQLLTNINKQILETEIRMRKTYQDLVFEVMDKNQDTVAPSKQITSGNKDELVVSSSRDMISQMKDKRKRDMLAKKNEEKGGTDADYDSALDAEFVEVK